MEELVYWMYVEKGEFDIKLQKNVCEAHMISKFI
jgi:hypothetical protein